MKIKQAIAMKSIRDLAAEIDGDWEPERKPLPVDPPGKLATAGRIAAFAAAAVVLSTVLLFWLVGCNSRQPCCCESRPTCPKSGGERCQCVACECPDGCPGVCVKKCCEPRKAHIIHPDGTQEHRPLTPDEEEQLRPMTVEEFEEFKAELRKGLTPHWEDGRWEIVKRWPKPYPFVTWGWVWDGRKDEPTIFMESSEASPPAKPPRWLPHPIEDVVPGTKNNL